jgi:hypothetical protein
MSNINSLTLSGIVTLKHNTGIATNDVVIDITLLPANGVSPPSSSELSSTSPSKQKSSALTILPTKDQTISLESCACDGDNKCFPPQQTQSLTPEHRTIRICLVASPINAEMKVSFVQTSENLFSSMPAPTLRVKEEGFTALVTGQFDPDFFDLGLAGDILVIGKASINVAQGNNRAEAGFAVRYVLKQLTASPTNAPTISALPTGLPPLGARVCQCDSSDVCVKAAVVIDFSSRLVRICVFSTPEESDIVKIHSLVFSKTTPSSPSDVIQAVIVNDQEVDQSFISLETKGRVRSIVAALGADFFEDGEDSTLVKVSGFCTVMEFEVDSFAKTMTAAFEATITAEIDIPTQEPTTYVSRYDCSRRLHSPRYLAQHFSFARFRCQQCYHL